MAPDPEVNAQTRRVVFFLKAYIPTSPDMNIQHVDVSRWMFPISVCRGLSWVLKIISSNNLDNSCMNYLIQPQKYSKSPPVRVYNPEKMSSYEEKALRLLRKIEGGLPNVKRMG